MKVEEILKGMPTSRYSYGKELGAIEIILIEKQRRDDAQHIADNYVKLPQVSDIINWINKERSLNVEAFAGELQRWLKERDGE